MFEWSTCNRILRISFEKPNNYKQKIAECLGFPLTSKRRKKKKKPSYIFSICLTMNVNANARKWECVFSHDEDMTEADVCVRPQDRMS